MDWYTSYSKYTDDELIDHLSTDPDPRVQELLIRLQAAKAEIYDDRRFDDVA